MDQKPEVKEVKKFDIDAHSARTKTPLPGLRDSDLNQEALPSARHAVKEEYSDYVKLAKSGGHQEPIFMYNAELWNITTTLEKKIAGFQHRILRWMLGVKWQEKKKNTEIDKIAGMTSWVDKIKEKRRRWTGHMLRLDDETPVKKALREARRPGRAHRGRKKYIWITQTMTKDFKDMKLDGWNEAERAVQDRVPRKTVELVVPHLGYLKRRVEFLIIVMSANSGSFAHLGLLKIDGAAKEQNGDVRPRSRINDTDSAYVKMAKIGGHANLLKMDGVAEEVPTQKKLIKEHDSTYVKIAKSGGHSDLLKTNGAPVVESPRKNQIKETDSEYIKLAKKGGHSGLLKSDGKEAENAVRKNKIKDSDSEYVRLAKAGGHSNLLASESTTPKAESSLPRRRTSNEGSDYVKLAKKGGDADLLKMVEKKPATPNQKYKSASSDWFQHNDKRTPEPITTGKGKGARKDTNNNSNSVILPSAEPQTQKSGKRLYQAVFRDQTVIHDSVPAASGRTASCFVSKRKCRELTSFYLTRTFGMLDIIVFVASINFAACIESVLKK
eukprot:gene13713-4633_t